MWDYLDDIIHEQINGMVGRIISESKLYEFMEAEDKSDSDGKKKKDREGNKKRSSHGNRPSKKSWFRRKALKRRGGLRSDYDAEYDKKYNTNVSDMDQSDIEKTLKSGFLNMTAVASKLYPHHTKTGAESQLRKKINHEKSDSGSVYRLRKKEYRKLKSIMSALPIK